MNIKEYIKKLQALPETRKKIVFFSVMAFAVLIVGIWGFFATKNNIEKIGNSLGSVNLPKFDVNPQDSGINLPDMTGVVSQGDSSVFQDQNSDWKTYANEEYGLEFQYPPNLSIKEHSSDKEFISKSFEDNGRHPFWISFGNSNEKNIVEMTHLQSSDYTEIKNGKIVVNDITWNTLEAIDIPNEGKGTAGSLLNVFTQRENLTYVFQCVNCNSDLFEDNGENKKLIFDKILKTLKFTK